MSEQASTQKSLPASAEKVAIALAQLNASAHIKILPSSARTAQQAADALGCTPAQIVKSLIFQRKDTGAALLLLVSGAKRVDFAKVSAHLGAEIHKPDAAFVRDRVGFAIGGIPPLGHKEPLPCLMDDSLLALTIVWAAAGVPEAVFAISPQELQRLTKATILDLKEA